MHQTIQSVGIMGGTFDPVHMGHLVAAETARFEFNLDKVIFVPAGHPPHKESLSITPGEDRFAMTALAIQDNPGFEISRIELDRSGPSFTLDTVTAFSREFGPLTRLFFITGADAILDILGWWKIAELMKQCYFVAATRPGYHTQELEEFLKNIPEEYMERVYPLRVPEMDISSTEIRKRLAIGKTVKYLLPERVLDYIYKNGLYQG